MIGPRAKKMRELQEQRRADRQRIAQLEVGIRGAVAKLREPPINQEPRQVAARLERLIS
jgi:hypothetical protein